MSGDESSAGSEGTIPESDAETVLDVIGQMLMTGTFDSSSLPGDPELRKRLVEILLTLGAVQNFTLSLSKGDLDSRLEAKGISAGSLKSLQSNLKHLTWQAQQITTGDFSQHVDFMGEFSEAFNHMVMALDAGRAKMKQRELELSSLNARLLTEITVRRQVEEALRLQNQIFETIAEGVYIIRASDGVIVYTNTKFEKMFGYEPGELIGKRVSVVNAPEDKMSPGDTAEAIMKALNETGEWRGEVKNIRKNGTTFWCLAVVSTFRHPEFGNVWIAAHTDISEQKLAEDGLRQSNRKLNLLSSITRHDIRNQLFALKGFLELSKICAGDTAKISEYIIKAEQAANAIERQIAFTKEYQDLGVKAAIWTGVDACVKKAQVSLPMRGIRVVMDCPDIEVYADPLFEKVFYNLIDNALRYGGADMTMIRVTSQESETGLVISTEDDGVGISADDRKRLFERGFGHNTGLGLFLSREILSITGIMITETGEPGKGARFEITVPKGAWRLHNG